MRRMSGPPAWGPAAVENVPLTISAKAATTLAYASHARRRGTAVGPPADSRASSTAARPVAVTATRK